MREAGNTVYKGLGYRDRLKSEFAYRTGKDAWGIIDEMGQPIPKGTPAYDEQKQKDRAKALEIASRV